MSTDGQIDYRGFTRAQLEDALQNISRTEYPLNYAKLTAELATRPPAPPKGAELPERLVIADRLSFLVNRLLPLVFIGIGLIGTVLLIFSPSYVLAHVRITGTDLGLTPLVSAWIGMPLFFVAGAVFHISGQRRYQVVLVRDQLQISNLSKTISVPLFDVEAVSWISRGHVNDDAEIEIRLATDTDFGRRIRCNPARPEPVTTLQEILEYRAQRRPGSPAA